MEDYIPVKLHRYAICVSMPLATPSSLCLTQISFHTIYLLETVIAPFADCEV